MLDMYIACVVAIALAFGVYHFVRKQSPETGWNYHGNVQTSAYKQLDIIGIGILLLIYSATFALLLSTPDSAQQTAEIQEQVSPTFMAAMTFVLGLVSQLLPVGIVLLFLAIRYNVLELFGLKNVNWKKVFMWAGIGLVGGFILAIASALVFQQFIIDRIGKPEAQEAVRLVLEAKKNNPLMLVFVVILATIVAPLCEEFVFRGYLYGVTKRFSCRYFAAISSSMIFALVHMNLWSLPALFALGLAFAIIYEMSGSLWANILAHAGFNSIQIFLMLMANESDLPY